MVKWLGRLGRWLVVEVEVIKPQSQWGSLVIFGTVAGLFYSGVLPDLPHEVVGVVIGGMAFGYLLNSVYYQVKRHKERTGLPTLTTNRVVSGTMDEVRIPSMVLPPGAGVEQVVFAGYEYGEAGRFLLQMASAKDLGDRVRVLAHLRVRANRSHTFATGVLAITYYLLPDGGILSFHNMGGWSQVDPSREAEVQAVIMQRLAEESGHDRPS